MKTTRAKIFIASLLVMVLAVPAAAKNKVVIVPGLNEAEAKSVSTYAPFFKGIEDVLSANNTTWEYHYVGLDGALDDTERFAIGKKAISAIKALNPDVIIAVNDNVVKFVATEAGTTPVVAGFFWGSPESLGLPTANITGVARRSFAADIWSMTNQIFGATTVSLLSKNSFSMAQIRTGILGKADVLEKASGVRVKEMYLCDTYDEWKKHVNNWSEDIIYLADASRLMAGDKEIPADEVVRWTVENAKVPVVGANEEAARDGAVLAIVTSEEIWGRQTGEMAVKIINGTPVSEIPVESVVKGKLIINGKTAMDKGIDIPYEIISSADQVYE